MNLPQDYETYKEIMSELLQPIPSNDLDQETIRKLYESKLVYLQNLRLKCFNQINRSEEAHFTVADYELILSALKQTRIHIKEMILSSMEKALDNYAGR